jgi:hypothetical protein
MNSPNLQRLSGQELAFGEMAFDAAAVAPSVDLSGMNRAFLEGLDSCSTSRQGI